MNKYIITVVYPGMYSKNYSINAPRIDIDNGSFVIYDKEKNVRYFFPINLTIIEVHYPETTDKE